MRLTRALPSLGDRDYLLSGFAGAAIFGAIAITQSVDRLAIARLLTVGFALGWVTVSDLRERKIPNRITIPATAISLGLSLASGGEGRRLLTVLAVCLPLLAVGLLFPRELGMGDVKLVVLIMVGFGNAAPKILGISLVIAAGVTVIRGRGDGIRATIPLAPFVAIAAFLATGP
jgi:leader peptidase (prepilin peptidase) / N-methyltransferase